jgi:hypothetical protein
MQSKNIAIALVALVVLGGALFYFFPESIPSGAGNTSLP